MVSVSKMLYCVISAIAEAAPAVGSSPGGSSVIASTIESFFPCASALWDTASGSDANAATVADWVRTVRRFNMILLQADDEKGRVPPTGTRLPSSPRLAGRGKRVLLALKSATVRRGGSASGTASSRARVYGCSAWRNSRSGGPCSTMRPCHSTATSSHR